MSRTAAASDRLPVTPGRKDPRLLPWSADAGRCCTVGLLALVLLLVVLHARAGLGAAATTLALGCGAVLVAGVQRALTRAGRATLGPADVVTLTRALLGCAAAALAAETLLGRPVTAALLVVVVPALALDAVDGRVARRTGTVSAFGGRFDGEVDAFVILVLSVAAVPSTGWWVLSAGLARYVFAAAGWPWRWMRSPLPFRYWRKVVTATVGVLLTVAVADVLPRGVTVAAALTALALLAESFGRDVWWLWRRRTAGPRVSGGGSGRRWLGAGRRGLTVVGGVVAVALVWFALVAPTRPDLLTPRAFVRLPLEVVLIAGALLLLPARRVRPVALLAALALAALAVVKALDVAMFSVLDRRFDLLSDQGQARAGLAFVTDTLGPWAAAATVTAVVVVLVGVVTCLVWAVGRLAAVSTRHPVVGRRIVVLVGAVWVVAALSGARVAPAEPFAAADAGPFVVDTVRATAGASRERQGFERAIAADPFARADHRDLAALRGKDVLLVFVESYGRVAVDGPGSQPVQRLLDAGSARLRSLGWCAHSAWLTSPTFGSNSWLAHSTLQSGLPVTDQGRYDRLLASRRTTLTSAFGDAGWRTVGVLPSTHGRWPQGRAFYGFDEIYARDDLGYAGPAFGFSAMPDQYALAAFGRRELDATSRPPVMAELELTSSHGPWAPLPTMVDPATLGDGSVYAEVKARAATAAALWSDRSAVPAAYRASIEYSLTSLFAFVEQHADDDLVLVVLGDHQPSTAVSGFGGNRDVPVTVLARDPRVLQRMSGWGWQEGLRPGGGAPVLPMDAFRDRFLSTFSEGAMAVSAQGRR